MIEPVKLSGLLRVDFSPIANKESSIYGSVGFSEQNTPRNKDDDFSYCSNFSMKSHTSLILNGRNTILRPSQPGDNASFDQRAFL